MTFFLVISYLEYKYDNTCQSTAILSNHYKSIVTVKFVTVGVKNSGVDKKYLTDEGVVSKLVDMSECFQVELYSGVIKFFGMCLTQCKTVA